MFREKLGPTTACCFDFYQEAPVSFWMKNTLILDDMVHRRRRHDPPRARQCQAAVDRHHPERVPVRGVLREINGGGARLLGVKPGDNRSSTRSSGNARTDLAVPPHDAGRE